MTHYRHHHNGLSEFLAAAKRKSDMPDSARASMTNDDGFSGGSFDGAWDKVTNGSPEDAARMRKQGDALSKRVRAMVKRDGMVYGVSGAVPDVGRMLTGEPEHMLDFTPTSGVGSRVATIRVTGCCNAGNDAETYALRGACVMALIDAAEEAGIACELVWHEHTHSSAGTDAESTVDIVLKRPNERLDVDRMAFCFGNVSFFRRIVFQYMETLPADERKAIGIGGGYGMTAGFSDHEDDAELYIEALGEDNVRWHDEGERMEWIFDKLEKLGVQFDREACAA